MGALPRLGDRVTITPGDRTAHQQPLAGQVVGYAVQQMRRDQLVTRGPFQTGGAYMIEPAALVLVSLDRGSELADHTLAPCHVDILAVHPDNLTPKETHQP